MFIFKGENMDLSYEKTTVIGESESRERYDISGITLLEEIKLFFNLIKEIDEVKK